MVDMQTEVHDGLSRFYLSHIVPLADQSVQVFQSFTYGEMLISLILLLILLVMVFKWIWEVLR